MAPIVNSNRRAPSGVNGGSKPGTRRSADVRRERRGGGGPHMRTGNKKAFYATRVAEQQEGASSDGDAVELEKAAEEDVRDSSEIASSEDEEYIGKGTVRSYGALLQSLAAHTEPDRRPRKRRRIEETTPESAAGLIDNRDLDVVDEPEEKEELEDLGIEEVDHDECDKSHDPFIKHLTYMNEEELESKIEAVKEGRWLTIKPSSPTKFCQTSRLLSVADEGREVMASCISDTQQLYLKQRLQGPAKKRVPDFDRSSGMLASSVFNYRDVLFANRTLDNAGMLRSVVCLHAVNHVLKTRDLIIKNNGRVVKETAGEDVEIRDQGFTRPKVLMLLPTRQSCVKYVETILSMCEPEQQENKSRFQTSYAADSPVSIDKPDDFRELFDGNDNDMFRLGMKFTRKTVKFFAQFYNSDIILASPLGLRMALGGEEPKKQDHDFLSSIEVLIVDQAGAIMMQNWEHVLQIFERLNLQPKETHGCDFSRVRNWYLDGNARYLRQTILISAFNFPSLTKLSTRHMLNVNGKVVYSQEEEGAIVDRSLAVKQIFSRFHVADPATEPDRRFGYFTTAVVPSLIKSSMGSSTNDRGILIFVPAYADFVRVRNYLATANATQSISFASISEYSSAQEIARARSHFVSGRHSVLLYTERAHHFRRYRLKGVTRIVMYGLPENPVFYRELVGGYLGDTIATARIKAKEASIRALFSKFDVMKLERIVGTARYPSLLDEAEGDTFEFTSAE